MSGIDPFFEPLTGVVRIPVAGPAEWQRDGLDEFYRAPNKADWGRTLCRVLFHESLHWWQVFSSGYLATLLAEDWRRLLEFERTGKLGAHSAQSLAHWKAREDQPFSAGELTECLARYWDIHTRGPHAIIEDEETELPAALTPVILEPHTGTPAYTSAVFDYLMHHGPESSDYERPYLWLLDRAGADTSFVALVFPVLAHAAFGSPDPVGVFCGAWDRALASPVIAEGVRTRRSGNINYDWSNHWEALIREAAAPVLRECRMLPYAGGADEILRGDLRSHPIYGAAVAKMTTLRGKTVIARMNCPTPQGADLQGLFRFAALDLAHRRPWAVFGLPGQPEYRYLLGSTLPPPRVAFENYAWTAERPKDVGLQETDGSQSHGEDYCAVIADLETRVARLRRAEYASSRGMPLDAFEANVGQG